MKKRIVRNMKSGKQGYFAGYKTINDVEHVLIEYTNCNNRSPIPVKAGNCIFIEDNESSIGTNNNEKQTVVTKEERSKTRETKEEFRLNKTSEPCVTSDNSSEKNEIIETIQNNNSEIKVEVTEPAPDISDPAQAPGFSPNKLISDDDPPEVLLVNEVYVDDYRIESIPDPAPVFYGVALLEKSRSDNALNVRPADIKPLEFLQAFSLAQEHFRIMNDLFGGTQYSSEIIKLMAEGVKLEDIDVALTPAEQAEYDRFTGKAERPAPAPIPGNVDLEVLRRAEKSVDLHSEWLAVTLGDAYSGLDLGYRKKRIRDYYHQFIKEKEAVSKKAASQENNIILPDTALLSDESIENELLEAA